MNIAVAGLGLIGGSMAMAVKAKTGHHVTAWDISPEATDMALSAGAADAISSDFSGADIVLAALYPRQAVAFLREHRNHLRPGAIVVDLCGVKRMVCREAEALLAGTDVVFIGGHPMAGRELSGFSAALPELFLGASMILTPSQHTPKHALQTAEDFFLSLGFGSITIATPERHDEIIAFTSQLAHIVSSAYVQNPAAGEHMGFSAGSFGDMTRVAKLNEEMWTELFLLNGDCLTEQLDGLIRNLTRFREAIAGEGRDELLELLRRGRIIREALTEEAGI